MKKLLISGLLLFNLGVFAYAQYAQEGVDEIIAPLSDDHYVVTEDKDCISGGPGSFNCSIQENQYIKFSCSTGCGTGKYACCTANGCGCRDIIQHRRPVN